MQIDEAKLSALIISALTGIGLTLFLNQALRDLGSVLAITVPVTLVMGAVLFVFASDNIKKDGDKPPKGE
jgi:preprotein translocase subunit SecY